MTASTKAPLIIKNNQPSYVLLKAESKHKKGWTLTTRTSKEYDWLHGSVYIKSFFHEAGLNYRFMTDITNINNSWNCLSGLFIIIYAGFLDWLQNDIKENSPEILFC